MSGLGVRVQDFRVVGFRAGGKRRSCQCWARSLHNRSHVSVEKLRVQGFSRDSLWDGRAYPILWWAPGRCCPRSDAACQVLSLLHPPSDDAVCFGILNGRLFACAVTFFDALFCSRGPAQGGAVTAPLPRSPALVLERREEPRHLISDVASLRLEAPKP